MNKKMHKSIALKKKKEKERNNKKFCYDMGNLKFSFL